MGLIKYSMDTAPKKPGEMTTTFAYDDVDDRMILVRDQDMNPILENNKRIRKENDGYSADRSIMRAGTIPMEWVENIIINEGWNPMDANESERCLQWLDRPENAAFKTVEAKVARKVERNYFRGSTSTKLRFKGDDE